MSVGSETETTETRRRKPSPTMTEVAAVQKSSPERRAFWWRKWRQWDMIRAFGVVMVHSLCLVAPFHFTWDAVALAFAVYLIVCWIGIMLTYHRCLSHRSFKLPKWIEYPFAYCGLLAIQGDPIDWVSTHRYHHQFTDTDRDPHSPIKGFWFSHLIWIFDTGYIIEKCGARSNVEDLKRQWFYWFLRKTVPYHVLGFAAFLYMWGGLPFLSWGLGIGVAMSYHVTFMINSVCHSWGSRAWKTSDTSRNVWWLSIFSFGESWHHNHHAFQSSARHGFEWWQIDINWYTIRFLESIGLATDVKLPSESQKQRLALVH